MDRGRGNLTHNNKGRGHGRNNGHLNGDIIIVPAGGESSSSGPKNNNERSRPRKLSQQFERLISQGRRGSVAKAIERLRSRSVSGLRAAGFQKRKRNLTFNEDEEEGNKERKKKHELDPEVARQQGNANMGSVVSALYAKLLVVMGCGFPLAEVISSYIPQAYYDGFYLYLYFVSIIFMSWIFAHVIQQKATEGLQRGMTSVKRKLAQQALATGLVSPPPGPSHPVIDIEVGGGESEKSEDERDKMMTSDSHDSDNDLEDGDCLSPLPPSPRYPSSPLTQDSQKPKMMMATHPPRHHHKTSAGDMIPAAPPPKRKLRRITSSSSSSDGASPGGSSTGARSHFGSFYLRIGAVAFGIGSLIYSGLEFGQYFELDPDTKCSNLMVAVTPVVRMVFTFMQMYFIFLNSRMAVSKVSLVKQFGLMHMVGTNLCVWLNVLIQETKHEIHHFYNPVNKTIHLKYGIKKEYLKPFFQNLERARGEEEAFMLEGSGEEEEDTNSSGLVLLHRVARGLKGPHSMYECGRENIIGSLVDGASPFLFPCTIEYSLICAAMCYVMWKSMAMRSLVKATLRRSPTAESLTSQITTRGAGGGGVRSPHHYTVDCAGSNKGFFIGIFFLVLTIMSLILNFVFMKHDDHMEQATFVVNVTEVILYSLSTLAVLIGMCRFRKLRYVGGKNLELDSILLIVAQSGSLVFNVFCVIGGHLTVIQNDGLVLIIPILCLIQLCLQTLFILDASKRVAVTAEQSRKKPGRETVSFLLMANLAMWLVNALEKSRGNSHPYLLHFYGVWAWTIITRISMPLAIFYRFHSTVCLCEIWKKAYKFKGHHR